MAAGAAARCPYLYSPYSCAQHGELAVHRVMALRRDERVLKDRLLRIALAHQGLQYGSCTTGLVHGPPAVGFANWRSKHGDIGVIGTMFSSEKGGAQGTGLSSLDMGRERPVGRRPEGSQR